MSNEPRSYDPDSASAPVEDLAPRDLGATGGGSGGRKWLPIGVLGLVIVALGVIVGQGLLNGTLFFHEVDQAVEKRDELGDERFRMLGLPIEGTIVRTEVDGEQAVAFTVVFDDITTDVIHIGDPPQLFQPDVPVTLEGRWVQGDAPVSEFVGGVNDGWFFESTHMLVKHDNDYINDNETRIDEAEERGAGYDGSDISQDS